MRNFVLVVGAVGLSLVSFLAGSANTPKPTTSWPSFSLHHDQSAGYLDVRGTWELETKDGAWPTQTTTLQCERATQTCQEVTVVLSQVGFLPVVINSLAIKSWTDRVVEICGSTAIATSERYLIDVLAKTVSGSVGPRNGNDCPSRVQKRMKLIDGFRQ